MRHSFGKIGTNLAKTAGFSLLVRWKGASTHKPKICSFPSPPRKMFSMFNIHRRLFLALKKVPIVRNTPCHIPNKKIPPAKFLIAPFGEMPLPLNAISKALNCLFALSDRFLGKPTNSITFVYQLFSIMLKCFIKNP